MYTIPQAVCERSYVNKCHKCPTVQTFPPDKRLNINLAGVGVCDDTWVITDIEGPVIYAASSQSATQSHGSLPCLTQPRVKGLDLPARVLDYLYDSPRVYLCVIVCRYWLRYNVGWRITISRSCIGRPWIIVQCVWVSECTVGDCWCLYGKLTGGHPRSVWYMTSLYTHTVCRDTYLWIPV